MICWQGQNLSPYSRWSLCLTLKDDRSSLRASSLGRYLDYFSSPVVPRQYAALFERKRSLKQKVRLCCQRTVLNLCSEAVRQAVLGTPLSPWSWMLFLIFLQSPGMHRVLVCLLLSQAGCDLLFQSLLAWARPAFLVECMPNYPVVKSLPCSQAMVFDFGN